MSSLPSIPICEQARLSRDARFDGRFFTAVKTTGIYCRPVCPAPAPKSRNIEYFANAASAEAAGYRPCLRCRPELSPADGLWRRGDSVVARATRLIEDGALDDAPMTGLASRLHVGERHLRRLFVDTLGVTPQQVQATRRLLFAKQLLSETALPITDIALASGFRSLRRFNDAFLGAYGLSPSRLRKHAGRPPIQAGPLQLKLAYRPPLDFSASLDFLRLRTLPGIERVGTDHYARVIDAEGAWLEVRDWGAGEPALRLSLHGVHAAALPGVVQCVRRMFDLDADPFAIHAQLADDVLLGPLIKTRPGLRLPGGWDGVEVAMRAVLGQQVSVVVATTLARRLVSAHGHRLAVPIDESLHSLFPLPAQLADVDLTGIGLPARRAATLNVVAKALRDGDVGFAAEQSLDDFIARWSALPGIGDWTAQYIAMRGLRHPDAFPAGDLVLKKQAGGLTEKQLRQRAEAWRPWRSYAVIQLWRAASAASASP